MPRYQYRPFGYVAPPELSGTSAPARYPVVIVGAGPVGLSLAIDLALRGVASVVLDDNDVVSIGSRAICWAKRTLEIFDRLGVACAGYIAIFDRSAAARRRRRVTIIATYRQTL